MAHIKCRYFNFKCSTDLPYVIVCSDPFNGFHCENFCDYDYEDTCVTVFSQCKYAWKNRMEFEGDYKRYELDDDTLLVSRKKIPIDYIEYLDIDNRVLIGGC